MTSFSVPAGNPMSGWSVWLAPALLLVALVASASCSDSESPVAPGQLRDCVEVTLALEFELAAIQSCTAAAQCGQVLAGTSCGCTRDLVARLDADTASFEAIVARGRTLACPATEFGSTCDCPAADGFACVDGSCTWNYL